MKIIFKQLTVFCIGLVIILSSGYLIGGDRYLPWVPKEEVYAILHKAEATALADGRYSYNTHAVNAAGERRQIRFETAHPLREGVYMKLQSKGNYTSASEVVQAKDVPKKALLQLY